MSAPEDRLSIEEWKGVIDRENDPLKLKMHLLTLAEEKSQIKTQLSKAKSASHYGEYSDRDWFRRTEQAERMYGILMQRINVRLSAINSPFKAMNAARYKTGDAAFVTVCRRRMDPAIFEEYMREAIALSQSQ